MHFKKELLQKNKRKQICLREDDVQALSQLLNSGYSIVDAMHILSNSRNKEVFETIELRLKKGEQLENFIEVYLPSIYHSYLQNFLLLLPFQEAIELTLIFVGQIENQRKMIVKKLFYPISLFVGMCAGIYLFDHTVLPNMLSLMQAFQVTSSQIFVMAKTVEYVSGIFLFITIVSITIVFLSTRNAYIQHTYRLIANKFPNSLLIQIASLEFASFYLEFIKKNVSTAHSLGMMKNMTNRPLLTLIAGELDRNIQEGNSLTDAITSKYVENSLARFIQLAVYSSTSETMLAGYIEMCQKRMHKQIQIFTQLIQLFCYASIGIVVIFVYQVLLLPMQVIQQVG